MWEDLQRAYHSFLPETGGLPLNLLSPSILFPGAISLLLNQPRSIMLPPYQVPAMAIVIQK